MPLDGFETANQREPADGNDLEGTAEIAAAEEETAALEEADRHGFPEDDVFSDLYLLSAITDEILFDS